MRIAHEQFTVSEGAQRLLKITVDAHIAARDRAEDAHRRREREQPAKKFEQR